MKNWNKSYQQLVGWYYFDDESAILTCPYCGNPCEINKNYDGIHANFNLDKYYKPTCNSHSCILRYVHDTHVTESKLKHLDKLNANQNRPDWIARSSRSRLINRYSTGKFYIAISDPGEIKIGVTSDTLISRSNWSKGLTYRTCHLLFEDSMTKVANFEYNLKKLNSWSEVFPNLKIAFDMIRLLLSDETKFEFNPRDI